MRRNRGGFSLLEVLVALAIIGVGVISLVELFSLSLRSVRKSGDYSRAMIYAGSLLDEAYATPEISDIAGSFDLGKGFRAERTVRFVSSENGVKLYEVKVEVFWPLGHTELKGKRTLYEEE